MSSVWSWLAELGCEQYTAVFEASGYSSVDSLGSLDEARLQSLGVFDANHRRAIMHKAQAGAEADLDNVLTDLTSVIADLEAFTVPSKAVTTTNPATPRRVSLLQVCLVCLGRGDSKVCVSFLYSVQSLSRSRQSRTLTSTPCSQT
jgi:hypothetical protein